MKKNGFIASSLLYGMLALFLTLMISTVGIFANNKLSMDKLKEKAFEDIQKVEEGNSCLFSNAFNINSLKSKVVTSGDGLYADPVESNRYVYKGANPNNYICLDALNSECGKCSQDDLYRIIAIESDGTLKVIKNIPIDSIPWDLGYVTSKPGITSTSSTAGTRYSSTSTDYCYYSSDSKYYGCNSWGSSSSTYASNGTTKVTKMPWQTGSSTTYTLSTYDSYLNVYLNGGTYPTESGTPTTITSWYSSQNSTIKNNTVENYTYNIGPLTYNSGQTIATDIAQESAYKWKGKVALINASDYVRASTNSACTGVYAYQQTSGCYSNSTNHNWLFNSMYQWTLSPSSGSPPGYIWDVDSSGRLSALIVHWDDRVRPVFHLKSTIKLTGSGTNDENVHRITP